MNTVSTVVTLLGSGETTRPRLTHYGPQGRIELSGRVLLNWVSKAMNLLQEEFDVATGSRIAVDLPPTHWRTSYWSLAVWQLGATVVTRPPSAGPLTDVDVLVTDADLIGPATAAGGVDVVAVTLTPLARRAEVGLPDGVLDEAAELSSYGDVASPLDEPDDTDVALDGGPDGSWTFADVAPASPNRGERLLLREVPSPPAALRAMLGAWASDGSVVVAAGGDDPERIAADERVTRRF